MQTVFMKEDELIQSAKEVFDIEANSILRLKERQGQEFVDAINILYGSKGKVVVTGMGKSGLIGKKIAATLCSTGTPAVFLHPAESTHGDSGIITRDDVVIGISNSGETAELLNLLPLIKRFGVPLIGMTGKTDSTLAKRSDVVLDVSVEREACPLNKAPTASTTVTLALGDALAVCLLKKRGFSYEDFLVFHPSGALGKGILYKVSDLMLKDEKLPVVDENLSFIEAVKLISDKKLGCAYILNQDKTLKGVITDGDIRRILLKYGNINDLKVKDVMVLNPKHVNTDDLAAKALSIMEKYSITSLGVTENDKLIGIIHIHDLLKAGVA
ncbi:MAG: KpsF/GutQ family sugar-phosphate isomerase [Candidatus Gastranaerophilales bacterium]|nr:KpsF/GutQ family sugar-phosphate isomerase [Candidatus Gastranaerophilales bacterium]